MMYSVTPVTNVASHSDLRTLMEAISINFNTRSNNSFPIDTNSTVLDDAKKRIQEVIYDSYGKITTIQNNNLIGRA